MCVCVCVCVCVVYLCVCCVSVSVCVVCLRVRVRVRARGYKTIRVHLFNSFLQDAEELVDILEKPLPSQVPIIKNSIKLKLK